ncbi:MAG: class B sortase, partial [Oscillospiraceae bacterium]|nr:class B sortase [Oscillospiraceae bacterium]
MNRKILMIPASILLIFTAVFCFGMLYLSWSFSFPAKTVPTWINTNAPSLTRAEYVQPTETPAEEIVEETEETVPEGPYYMQLDMNKVASHYNTNHDVVGWIRIADTAINYPIMQNADNNFYVDHAWNGSWSSAGAIFADWRCRLESSDNTLVYGH